jgi:hypothetical protein
MTELIDPLIPHLQSATLFAKKKMPCIWEKAKVHIFVSLCSNSFQGKFERACIGTVYLFQIDEKCDFQWQGVNYKIPGYNLESMPWHGMHLKKFEGQPAS